MAEGNRRLSKNIFGTIFSVLCIGLALFHIYTAAFGSFATLIQRPVHLGVSLVLCFLKYPLKKKDQKISFFDIILSFIALGITFYVTINSDRIIMCSVSSSVLDKALGVTLVLLVIEGGRRVLGLVFPVLTCLSIFYAAFLGPLLGNSIFYHRGFSSAHLIEELFFSSRGIWGSVMGISSTIIGIFVVFGAFLKFTGGGESFINIGKLFAGRSKGGAAKVTVIASSLMGMVSGSSPANVAATGVYTLPMMEKLGYRKEFSAASVAVASTGGQIMPPVMGAAAFILAEFVGISYLSVVGIGFFPAILYYVGCWYSIHSNALKYGLASMEEKKTSLKDVLPFKMWVPFVLPMSFLFYLLIIGRSITYSVFLTLVVCVFISLFIVLQEKGDLIKWSKHVLRALRDGGEGVVMIAIMLGCAQIIISMIGITGLGVKLSYIIMAIGKNSILLALISAAGVVMLLGMGVPTTAAYVIGASVAGPALIELGLKPLIAHYFIFFYACLSAITPPICAAVFVAAGMAKANWLKTGFEAVKLGLSAYFIPFFVIYNSDIYTNFGLMSLVKMLLAICGVVLIGFATGGYFLKRSSNIVERITLVIAGVLLLTVNSVNMLIVGIIITIVNVLSHLFIGMEKDRDSTKKVSVV